MLQLTREQFDQIIHQGLEGKPLEICGLLAGAAHPPLEGETLGHTIVEAVYPIESDDKSEVTYTLNSTQYFKAVKDIEARGLHVVGIYHTHPATQAFPSKTDVARAHWGDTEDLLFPEYSYLIVSLRDPTHPEPHSFKIRGRNIPDDIVEEPVAVI